MIAVNAPALSHRRFSLNTGRNRDQWHTMMRTGKSARLGAHLAEPYVEINPADSDALGVTPGALVELETMYGRSILRALITPRVARGQLFAPMHWTRQRTTKGTVNSVTAPVLDPVSGQPALKLNAVTAQLYRPKWYGFLACINEPVPQTPYAAITALFFAAPTPVVVSRSAIIDMIGTDTAPLAALAGRSPSDRPDAGATVCACFNVGRNTLLAAVSNGADSVAALGEATCAGTNCGSCKPELTALVAQAQIPMAAE